MAAEPLHLLIIEDSDSEAERLVSELAAGGYSPEYRRVSNRAEMLDALESDTHWDVILSNHQLEGFSSTWALLQLLEREVEVPFIIVSDTIGEEQAVEAMKAGARDYVMKDKLNRLVPAVRIAIKESQAIRQRLQAEQEIKESRKRLRELTSHLETVREEERKTIARDIHDELGGILTALKIDISWLRRHCPEPEADAAEKMEAMSSLTDQAIHSVRRIITELRPAILDDLGLLAALEWQLNDFRKRYDVTTSLVQELGDYHLCACTKDEVMVLPNGKVLCFTHPSHGVAIFRIFQEALTNVARHAHADAVRVTVRLSRMGLQITLEDNGIGIDEECLGSSGSYGILGMHERALQMGGEVEVTRLPRGSQVSLRVPVEMCCEEIEGVCRCES